MPTMVLRWEYVRGSTLFLVWNLSTSDTSRAGVCNPLKDLGGAFGAPGTSILAIKINYWLTPWIRTGVQRRSCQRRSGRSYQVTSQYRPNFRPFAENVPTGRKPNRSWSDTDAGLGRVMPATIR